MRDRLTTVGELAGATSIVVGCCLAWLPFGLIVGGVALVAVSYLAGDS